MASLWTSKEVAGEEFMGTPHPRTHFRGINTSVLELAEVWWHPQDLRQAWGLFSTPRGRTLPAGQTAPGTWGSTWWGYVRRCRGAAPRAARWSTRPWRRRPRAPRTRRGSRRAAGPPRCRAPCILGRFCILQQQRSRLVQTRMENGTTKCVCSKRYFSRTLSYHVHTRLNDC